MPLLSVPSTTKTLNSPSPFHHHHRHATFFQSKFKPKFQFHPILNLSIACKSLDVAVSSSSPPPDSKLRIVGSKHVDVATLGNLCVDIVLNVPQLPPSSVEQRKAFMEHLASSPPPKVCFSL